MKPFNKTIQLSLRSISTAIVGAGKSHIFRLINQSFNQKDPLFLNTMRIKTSYKRKHFPKERKKTSLTIEVSVRTELSIYGTNYIPWLYSNL